MRSAQLAILAVLLCAVPLIAQEPPPPLPKPAPKIEGPSLAMPGQEIRLSVTGLTTPPLSEGIGKLQEWSTKVSLTVDAPEGGEAIADTDLSLGLGAQSVRFRVFFTPSKGGVYFLVLQDANADVIATKRITVGPVEVVPPAPNPLNPSPTDPNRKATAATYVYEKSQHQLPIPVLGALSKLNTERAGSGFVGSSFEQNTVNSDGQVPKQYRVALEAARKEGLPCLVVTAGDTVLAVVKNPTTEAQVLEAVK